MKLVIVISRLYLLRESSYRHWNFWYVAEECVNEDAKKEKEEKEEKEKEKKRTLSVCCV